MAYAGRLALGGVGCVLTLAALTLLVALGTTRSGLRGGAEGVGSGTAPTARVLVGLWYNPELDVIQNSTALFQEMSASGVTDVVIAAGYIGAAIYTDPVQHCGTVDGFALPPCVGADYSCKGNKCVKANGPGPTLKDIIAHILPYSSTIKASGFKLWLDFSSSSITTADADAVLHTLSSTKVAGANGSLVPVLDVLEGATSDIEPPDLKSPSTQSFHQTLAKGLAKSGKRYMQWIGAESLTKAYILSIVQAGLTNFALIVTAYDRGSNPPYPIPPWMYEQLVTAQLGYTYACDAACQMRAPPGASECAQLTHSPFEPYGEPPDKVPTDQCSNPTGYGNAMCDGTTCPAGVGPLGWKLKMMDPGATIKVVIAAPFAATTSEWVHANGSAGEVLPPTWQPFFSNSSAAGSANYPACVMPYVQQDATTKVLTNTMVSGAAGGQGAYIAALGRALAAISAQDADFGKRYAGVEAYMFSYPVETIIPIAAPCGGARAKTAPCGKAFVFTTETTSAGGLFANKVPPSSWEAFKNWPSF